MSENKNVTRKDLYEKLWKSRDFEISHLWQRSLFLATFIVLIFTVYFTLLGAVIEKSDYIYVSQNAAVSYADILRGLDSENAQEIKIAFKDGSEGENDSCKYLVVLSFLCASGYIFSVLWIYMARGSKYMYECHEAGINKAHGKGYFDDDLGRQINIEYYEAMWSHGLHINSSPRHGFLPPPGKYDFSFFSTNGAQYSLSRINIVIGYVFLFIWILLSAGNFLIIKECCLCAKSIIGFLLLVIYLITPSFFAFSVHSGGDLNWRSVISLKWPLKRSKFKEAYKNKIEWILGFMQKRVFKEPLNSLLRNNVINNFREFLEDCDNPLYREVIDRFLNKNEKNNIRLLLYFRELRDIFEYTIMERFEIPERFCGDWVDELGFTRVSMDSKSIKLHLDSFYGALKGDMKLFADIDWKLICAGKQDSELEPPDKIIHMISKKNNDYDLYMTFDNTDCKQLDVSVIVTKYIHSFSIKSKTEHARYSFKLEKGSGSFSG